MGIVSTFTKAELSEVKELRLGEIKGGKSSLEIKLSLLQALSLLALTDCHFLKTLESGTLMAAEIPTTPKVLSQVLLNAPEMSGQHQILDMHALITRYWCRRRRNCCCVCLQVLQG